MKQPSNGTVAVLLATYNGAAFIEEQLHSLVAQDYPHIDIWLSDDGSNDDTLAIAKKFSKTWDRGKFEIIKHQTQSERKQLDSLPANRQLVQSNANFRSLIFNEDIQADYFAYCDQDDIWNPTKLSRAISWLKNQPASKPSLHCSRTYIIDSMGKMKGKSLLFKRPPSFKNAIIQNIAAGNTIVMNSAAMIALRPHSKNVEFVSHDWWSYVLISALQGNIRYDTQPQTQYRQHDDNLVGENASWRARMTRFKMVFEGRFKKWNDVNTKALIAILDDLPMESRVTLNDFVHLRTQPFFIRPFLLWGTGIHRQTFTGQISLFVALIFGKI